MILTRYTHFFLSAMPYKWTETFPENRLMIMCKFSWFGNKYLLKRNVRRWVLSNPHMWHHIPGEVFSNSWVSPTTVIVYLLLPPQRQNLIYRGRRETENSSFCQTDPSRCTEHITPDQHTNINKGLYIQPQIHTACKRDVMWNRLYCKHDWIIPGSW